MNAQDIREHVLEKLNTFDPSDLPVPVEGLLLYGSMSKGDNRVDSDINILVVFTDVDVKEKDLLENSIHRYPNLDKVIKEQLKKHFGDNPETNKPFDVRVVGSFEIRDYDGVESIIEKAQGVLNLSQESLASLLRITNVRSKNLDEWRKSDDKPLYIVGYFGSGYRELAKEIAGDKDVPIINFDAKINADEGFPDRDKITEIKTGFDSRGEKIIVVGTTIALCEFNNDDSILVLESNIFNASRKNADENFDGTKFAKLASLLRNAVFRKAIGKVIKLTKPDLRFNKLVKKLSDKISLESVDESIYNTYPMLKGAGEWIEPTQLLHISYDPKIKKFVPNVSKRTMNKENRNIPRISTSDLLLGCIVGYWADLWDFHNLAIGKEWNGGYYIYAINDKMSFKPNAKLLPDSKNSNEHWVIPLDESYWEIEPVKIGKFFYQWVKVENNTTHKARFQDQIHEINALFEIKEELKFTDKVVLSPGYWEINFIRAPHLKVVDIKSVKEITKQDFLAAKKVNADLLNLVELPPSTKW